MHSNQSTQQQTLSCLTLFASMGTLICCALPILMVSLGFGAVVASLTSSLPILITLAAYESWMFAVSAILLAITAWLLWFRPQQCPNDPVLAQRCEQSRSWSRRVFWVAIIIWSIGFSAAFLFLPIRKLLGL
ncbi:MAG: hypothetical protein HRU20_09190 [Pseudomonadales bacterium]|nr:hypothetical protein [Pseudomonadales bacterium]